MTIELDQVLPLVGSNFSVETTTGTVELRLVEASELPRRNRPEKFRTPLSLIFTSPAQVQLAQDNFWISHASIGRHIWTIAPVLPPMDEPVQSNDTRYYQVMFG